MSLYTLAEFRQCIAEQSDTGMLIAADFCDESDDATTKRIGMVLRRYVDIQTYVRMSLPIPLEMANEFKAANDSFEMPLTRNLDTGEGYYGRPLGPYYTELNVDQTHLANNLNLLSIEPVRYLTVTGCQANNDLAMILRNYRMSYAFEATFYFRWRQANANDVGQAVNKMLGGMMNRLTIGGVEDRLKMITASFHAAKGIRAGCELFVTQTVYGNRRSTERVAVKK